MNREYEGNAIVYCEGAFGTTNGKTAHGLVRRCERYRIVSVVDSVAKGSDAGEFIDGTSNGIPLSRSFDDAWDRAREEGTPATHLVIGLAPDGGRLPEDGRHVALDALSRGMHVVCGLHDFLTDYPELVRMAREKGVDLIDIRKPKDRSQLHFFSGKIEEVTSLKVAVLGTDSATGKRTTAWKIVDGLRASEVSAELVGTGQTAWLQGAKYSVVFDSLVNDFVSGEIEHAVWSAWKEKNPKVIVIEGQGSLMNPAYPGGFEILAAGRPECVVMQAVPGRKDYDGFPGYPIHALKDQIRAVEMISSKPVVAITVNPEGIDKQDLRSVCESIARETGLPVVNPLAEDIGPVLAAFNKYQ